MKLKLPFALTLLGTLLLEGITLEEALQKTMIQSPVMMSSLNEIEEREGERIQSGLYFNPLFSYTVENVFGAKHWKGWQSAESRYEFSQPIEIGGQRCLRTNIASYRISSAQFEYAALELTIANAVKKAFIQVAARQELVGLAARQRKVANDIYTVVMEKSASGKLSQMDINRARLGVVNAELAEQKAFLDLDHARYQLAALWGDACPDFEDVEFCFFAFTCPPPYEECIASYCGHPLLMQIQLQQLAALEETKLQKAIRIPNVVVTAGYKTLNINHERGMILGVAFPLGIFDRNQGNIYRSEAHAERAANRYAEVELALSSKLAAAHRDTMRAYLEVMQLQNSVMKMAEESFAMAKEGYASGKFEYLQLLDAEKMFFETEERMIEALAAFYKNQTDIEYLTL